MNTLEMRNTLVSHFLKKNLLTIDDINNIKVDDEIEKYKESIARSALKELEEIKMISALKTKDSDIISAWILNSPIGSNGQTIQLSYPIASEIATHVNSFKKSNGYEQDCDVLSITEDDIFFLCAIINTILKNTMDKELGQKEQDEE